MSIRTTSAFSAVARRQRVVREARGVGALVALDEIGRRCVGPDPQLLDRGGAERVAGGEDHLPAFAAELGGELADRRRLAGAVDADDQDDERLLGRVVFERAGDGNERPLDLRGEDRPDLVRIDALLVAPARDRLADAGRRAEAEVGLDQHVLQIVERGGVEPALGEDVGDAEPDARRRAREAEPEPLQPASLRRGSCWKPDGGWLGDCNRGFGGRGRRLRLGGRG